MFKLALNLHKTVAEIKETMSYAEFVQWQEYYMQEPFLADRLEMQLARIGYSNLFTGMSKVKLEYDYFLISHLKKESTKSKEKDLENKLKAIFGG